MKFFLHPRLDLCLRNRRCGLTAALLLFALGATHGQGTGTGTGTNTDTDTNNSNATQRADSPRSGGSTPAADSAQIDFSTFRIISERNIFNPNRASRSSRSFTRPTPRTETVWLVGTMSYGKGDVAFFDSSTAALRKAVKLNETIAGYELVCISPKSVKLERDGNSVELPLGGVLRREEGGSWELSSSSPGGSAGVTSTTTESSAPALTGAESDVLQRLMQRRQQEENQ